jgi:hypothetical protein
MDEIEKEAASVGSDTTIGMSLNADFGEVVFIISFRYRAPKTRQFTLLSIVISK